MDGFFFKAKDPKKHKQASSSATERTRTKSQETSTKTPCEQCGLYKNCISPKMNYTGQGEKEILIIAEFPGKTEDEKNIQLIGEAGQLLRGRLNDLGMNLDRDFWKTNSVICRPPNNRKPTRKELKLCHANIEETIKLLKPKFIWLLGGAAVESFFMDRFSDLSINLWRRRLIPDYKHNCFVIPLYHPSYIMRNQDEKLDLIFRNDLKWALSCLNEELPEPLSLSKGVVVLLEKSSIINTLKNILDKKSPVVFDYETSSVNSFLPDPKIWSIGVNGNSFGLDHPDAKYPIIEIEDLWRKILVDEDIKKIAHNLKFEDAWSRARFKVIPKGWIHDTMVTQHVIEYRTTSKSLKFQSFVKWGVGDYEANTKSYLTNNIRNTLDQMSLPELLKYNAVDSLLTRKLWKCQEYELARNSELTKANNLFFDGVLTFCDVESNGICVDDEWYKTRQTELTKQIDEIENSLLETKESKKFTEQTGRELKIASSKDLKELFYDILKFKPTKTTVNGNASVDVDSLTGIKIPFVEKLLLHRKLIKIRDTYLAQFIRESIEGKIHPSFNLHIVDTYRSSSSNPNFQNIPVRDEDAKKETRSGIIPSKGNKLLEIDYSAMEVRIAACYTKDPALIDYINDPKSDMHADQAKLLFLAKDEEVSKNMRFHAKNGFVFPEIYGSYYKSCATNLWGEVKDLKTKTSVPLQQHLKKHGISKFDDFVEHVKVVEEAFWKKFPLIKEWKEENEKHYQRKGYIQFLYGHRRSGYLSRNALSNYPVQGAAFHCLLWSLIRLNQIRKERNWKTKIIGQIHDSIVFDLYPPEQNQVIRMAKKVMTKDIRNEFDFLIVPLDTEVEITEIDGSWYTKKKI
jgi:DNA polymerase I